MQETLNYFCITFQKAKEANEKQKVIMSFGGRQKGSSSMEANGCKDHLVIVFSGYERFLFLLIQPDKSAPNKK